MKRTDFELEVCANSIQSIIAAEEGGADRVEVISGLAEGGTTPSAGLVLQALERVDIDIFPIIRPRGGDFLNSGHEIDLMIKDIVYFREMGVHGFVFGCLRNDGRIDKEICSRLIEAAKGMPVTFHRAFDMTADPFEALDTLKKLGIKRILTSGQEDKAMEGIPLISRLVDAAGEELILMAGSGVNEGNIAQIAKKTGVRAFHISVREPHESEMKYRREGIHMGGSDEFNEFEYKFTSSNRVKACIRQLQEID